MPRLFYLPLVEPGVLLSLKAAKILQQQKISVAGDLAERVDAFQRRPAPAGINIKGKKRTTLKLFIPNLLFSQPIEMGENVWIYTGELNPAYCLFSPWAENTQVGQ